MKNKRKKINIIVGVITGIILIVLGIIFENNIEIILNTYKYNSSLKIYEELIVYFIDVNQGDCTCIKLPDNKIMIIDSGNYDILSKEKLFKALNKIVFKNRKDKIVDYLVLTHADSDHCGNIDEIFKNFEVKEFYRPMQYIKDYEDLTDIEYDENNLLIKEENISYYNAIKASNEEKGLKVEYSKSGIVIENKDYGYKIEFLSPKEKSYKESNEYSPIMVLSYKSHNILFTGDATIENEQEVLEDLPKCEFIKLGHHGSYTSTGEELLKKIEPKYAFISCGLNNIYNLPHYETIMRLKYYAKIEENAIYRTDIDGTIYLSISDKGEYSIHATNSHTKIFIEMEYLLTILILGICIIVYKLNKQIDKPQNLKENIKSKTVSKK